MDSKLIRALREWGCDTDSGLERVYGDVALYEKLLVGFFEEHNLNDLRGMLCRNKVWDAFMQAHRMKGDAATLGLTPFFKPLCGMTEVLRCGSLDVEFYLEQLTAAENGMEKIIADWKNELEQ